MSEAIPPLSADVVQSIEEGDLEAVKKWYADAVGRFPDRTTQDVIDTRDELIFESHGLKTYFMSKGNTVLHYAAYYLQRDITEFLLDNGADPTFHNEDQQSAMLCAMYRYDDQATAEVIQLLLRKETHRCVMIDEMSKQGWTPLCWIARMNFPKTLRVLLNHKAGILDMMRKDKRGNYPIHYLNQAKSPEEFTEMVAMLRQSVNLQNASRQQTLLHRVTMDKHMDYMKILIEDFHADTTIQDDKGRLALHYFAQECGNDHLAELMLLANRDAVATKDKDGYAPLHFAIQYNNCQMVAILLEAKTYGVDYSMKVNGERNCIHVAVLAKGDFEKMVATLQSHIDEKIVKEMINAPDADGMTPLHLAVKKEAFSRVETLLSYGADPTFKAAGASTNLLQLATMDISADSDFNKVVKYVKNSLKRDEEDMFRKLINAHGEGEKSALQLAIKGNMYSRLRTLLKYTDGDPAIQDEENSIHIATLSIIDDNNFKRVVTMFKENMSEDAFKKLLDSKDDRMKTSLHLALESKFFSRVETLLDFGADPAVTTTAKQHNLIHLAVITVGKDEEFEMLIDKIKETKTIAGRFDETVNATNSDGKSALQLALEGGKIFRAKKLLAVGADPSTVNEKDGKNCLHVAFQLSCPSDIVVAMNVYHTKEKQPDIYEVEDDAKKTPVQYLNEATPLSVVSALPEEPVILSTALEKAILVKRLDIVKLLMVKGASLSKNILQCAIVNEDVALAKILVRHAGEIKSVLKDRISSKELIVIKKQIEHDNPEQVDNNGHSDSVTRSDSVLYNAVEQHVEDSASDDTFEVKVHDTRRIRHSIVESSRQQNRRFTLFAGNISIDRDTTLFEELIQKMPSVANEALQRFTTVEEKQVTFDYSLISMDSKPNPLQIMVDNQRTELLQTPVVSSYLYAIRKNLAFWVYLVYYLVFYGAFLVSLYLFTLTAYNPLAEICTNGSAEVNQTETRDCGYFSRVIAAKTFATLVIILAFTHLCNELFQLWTSKLEYFNSLQNWMELFLLFPLSIVYVFIYFDECGCPKEWQWHLGILIVLLAWVDLMIIAAEFPISGTFILIFKEILYTILGLFTFALPMILAFAIILFMMFHNPFSQISSFTNVGRSFVKTVTMVTGEFDFDDIFHFGVPTSEFTPIPFSTINYIVWIIFLILVPIILSNMLTSLALEDTKEVRKKANLQKLTFQVQTVVKAYKIVRHKLRNFLLKDTFTFKEDEVTKSFPFEVTSHKLRFLRRMYQVKEWLAPLKENTYYKRREKEQNEIRDKSKICKEELSLSVKLDRLSNMVEALREALDNMEMDQSTTN